MARITLSFVFMAVACASSFDCDLFASQEAALDGGASLVKAYIQGEQSPSFDQECIHQAVKRNYFEATKTMVETYFSKDPKLASQAESTARNAVDQVRNQQNDFLATFEHIPKSIPVISPAFRWAQSLNQTFLEVKYSTRFDSPACLDIFDQEFRLEDDGNKLYLGAMCRNDKKLLKYELKLDLYEQVSVDEEASFLKDSSVGRVEITLGKLAEESRWKRLLTESSEKPPNMSVWWDVWEKYEKELEKAFPDEDDGEDKEDGEQVNYKSSASEENGEDGISDSLEREKKVKTKKKKSKKGKKKQVNDEM